MPNSIPRPWVINLVARALRLSAGRKNHCDIGAESLAGLTHLVVRSVWNALRVMGNRGWIVPKPNYRSGRQSAANSYKFTSLFPFPTDYFTADAQRFIEEISQQWPGKLDGREISLLWGFGRNASQDRIITMSRRSLSQELEWGTTANPRRRSIIMTRRIEGLAHKQRIRVIRTRANSGTGKWLDNTFLLAGPSGFLPEGPSHVGPVPKRNDLLRKLLLDVFRRRRNADGYAYIAHRELAVLTKHSEKAVKGVLHSLTKTGSVDCKRRDPRRGVYINGYKALSPPVVISLPPATKEQDERAIKHAAALKAGRKVPRFCAILDSNSIPYLNNKYKTWTEAYRSGDPREKQNIRKEKSRSAAKNWN